MRCTNPDVGIKVLSYDLLEGAERDELDVHLTECAACRDLKQQTFGDQGAFQELEYRAFRLSQRQAVQAREWWPSRLRALALPLSAILLLVLALAVYLARRPPEAPRVGIVRLAAMHDAELGDAGPMPTPRVSAQASSLVLSVDREANGMAYEVGAEHVRRLVPPEGAAPLRLRAFDTQEIPVPPLLASDGRVLLVLVPAEVMVAVSEWDAAIQGYVGARGASRGAWPNGVIPTLRWIE